MSGGELEQLGRDLPRLALLASEELEKALSEPEGSDVKRAKDLSGILKDLTLLARELRGQEARPVTVRFLGPAEEAAE